jgi:ATP-dependent Clp protease ATP-binding subunit ClpA
VNDEAHNNPSHGEDESALSCGSDKAMLTLGDNRRVDFSRAMIFMTSNLGAAEMGSILHPDLGFASGETQRRHAAGIVARAGIKAVAQEVHARIHEPYR